MAWNDLKLYFETTPSGLLKELFANAATPWAPLAGLQKVIEESLRNMQTQGSLPAKKTITSLPGGGKDIAYFLEETILLTEDFIDADSFLFIGKNTLIEAGATIKSGCYIEEGCEIRQGAYLRGNIYLGKGTVAGHTTEIKNSILLTHVEAGHFAYIGDSIIGSHVNLGAGTKISNLQFRSLPQKLAKEFTATEIKITIAGEEVATGLVKLGAIVGDGVEVGCNAVLSPGSLLMKEVWVMPNLSVPKGVYGQKTMLSSLKSCKSERL